MSAGGGGVRMIITKGIEIYYPDLLKAPRKSVLLFALRYPRQLDKSVSQSNPPSFSLQSKKELSFMRVCFGEQYFLTKPSVDSWLSVISGYIEACQLIPCTSRILINRASLKYRRSKLKSAGNHHLTLRLRATTTTSMSTVNTI